MMKILLKKLKNFKIIYLKNIINIYYILYNTMSSPVHIDDNIDDGELSFLQKQPLQVKSALTEQNNINLNMADVATVCLNTQNVVKKFKSRLNYRIYNLMLPTLLLFLIIFCVLIWKKSSNTIKMSELSDNIIIASDEFNKSSDAYDAVYTNESAGHVTLTKADEFRKQKQSELDDIKKKYNYTIYIDNYCDKLTDLCNGIIGGILMVYIGSAGYKMIRLNERNDKDIKTCPLPAKSLLERVFNKTN